MCIAVTPQVCFTWEREENLQCFPCCKVQNSENFLKEIHIVCCCLFNGCICATTFTSCWEGRLNPIVGRQNFGKRGGKEAGQAASKGQVQWSKQNITSLSQEVPVLDRKAPLNLKNPKVKLLSDSSLVLFSMLVHTLCSQRHLNAPSNFFKE